MGANEPHWVQPTLSKVCRICGQEFLAKRSNTEICYTDFCRGQMRRRQDAARRKRQKQATDGT